MGRASPHTGVRQSIRAVVFATVIALVASGTAGASKKSDQKLADRALLTVEDLPEGFREVTLPTTFTIDTADACSEGITQANEIADAAPSNAIGFEFDPAQGYANIHSGVAVLPKAGKAKKVLNAFQDGAAVACIEDTFAAYLTQPGLTVEILSAGDFSPERDDFERGNKKVVKGGDEFAGISASINRSVEGGPPQEFQAIAVFGRVGRAVFQLRFVATGTIQDLVQDLMQTVVTRLKKAK